MSPLNVISWTDVISSALGALDPENAEYYAANADAYKASLRDIDNEAKALFSSIPKEKRILVSDHRTFGYFSRDYDFKDLGALIPGFSTNADISAGDLSGLIEEVNEHTAPALFMGNTSGNAIEKLAEILKDEVDHPIEILTILTGSLNEEEPGESYLSFIRFNIQQIARGISP